MRRLSKTGERKGPERGASATTGFVQRLREARRLAQPREFSPSVTDEPYRLISIFPSLLLARLGITPNQITLFWVLLGLVGVAALGSAEYTLRVAGALLLQFSYLLDYVDGEVARLQKRSSKKGMYYDLMGHGLVKTGLFLALGYQAFRSLHSPEILILAFFGCVSISNGYALPFYAASAGVRTQPSPETVQAPPVKLGTTRKLLNLTSLLFESPGLYAVVLLGVMVDQPQWVVVFYGLTGPVWFLHRLLKYRYE